MTKRALIFGVGGQDGSYCADLLLDKGYEVHGVYRRSSYDNLARVAPVRDQLTLHVGDVTDFDSVLRTIMESAPDEVYNFADQDEVGYSHEVPLLQLGVTAGGCANILRAVHLVKAGSPDHQIRIFQPLSATMFGDAPPTQCERTGFTPASPYAIAKVAAACLCAHYRREYGVYVASAIYFNHDSPRRGPGYLLQRIARGEKLTGDLDAVVDIGYAPEYVEAAWKILQLDKPDVFCIGTGIGYRIRDLVEKPIQCSVPFRSVHRAGDTMLVAHTGKAQEAFGWEPRHDAASVLALLREYHS